ncbi:MAG: glycosyltransferase family 2 protein [bacterium]|nr:glycosyltransferase family 2 protein [bacterium]
MTDPSIRISAVICTSNRSAVLPSAIDSLLRQEISNVAYEILVVDNASTDETANVVQQYLEHNRAVSIRYLFEPLTGLSRARNLAVAESQGDIIAFLDDDAIADHHWLAALLDVYDTNPAAWAVGGKVKPVWEAPRPIWMTDDIVAHLAILDLGDELLPVSPPRYLVGANCSFRRQVFKEVGLFETNLGRYGTQLLDGEEAELLARIREHGGLVLYAPHVIVGHRIQADRTIRRYFINYAYQAGRSRARRAWLYREPDVGLPRQFRRLGRSSLDMVRQWLRLLPIPWNQPNQIRALERTADWFGFLQETVRIRQKRTGKN